MKIRIVCQNHPNAEVFLLEGTVKYLNVHGDYVDENSERATTIEVDEYNLYCCGEGGDHDFLDVRA